MLENMKYIFICSDQIYLPDLTFWPLFTVIGILYSGQIAYLRVPIEFYFQNNFTNWSRKNKNDISWWAEGLCKTDIKIYLKWPKG